MDKQLQLPNVLDPVTSLTSATSLPSAATTAMIGHTKPTASDANDPPSVTHSLTSESPPPPRPARGGQGAQRGQGGARRGQIARGEGRPRPSSRPSPLSASTRKPPALSNVLANQRTLDFSHHTGNSAAIAAAATAAAALFPPSFLPPLHPQPPPPSEATTMAMAMSSSRVTPLWLTLSKSKQDLQAWACLSTVPNADPAGLDPWHLDSIYREHPLLHRICPLRYGGDIHAARAESDTPVVDLRHGSTSASSSAIHDENGNESDPIEDPDSVPSSALQAAAGIVDFGRPHLPPPGASAPSALPPFVTSAPISARGPTPTCTARTCKDNPNCLNYIGIAAWLEAKTRTKYIADHLASHASTFPTRLFQTFTSNRPVLRPAAASTLGLTNLGATCYANALLQCWYADMAFRARVYAYATHDPAIHALALVFAAMQCSQQPWLAPRHFLEYLEVERGVQQDAQEFGKLVLQLMDDRCKTFESTSLMGGKGQYVTTCTACGTATRSPHTFHEVLVHPSAPGDNVQDLVDRAVRADELLEGDNAVLCQVCAAKQPAKRHLELQSVSRTMCVQVLRFTYDAKTHTRKKNATSIKIPKQLQLVGEAWALTGVVVHKGRTAHAGHYVAVVRQHGGRHGGHEQEQWITVDDEKVTTLGARDSWTKDPINSTEAYLLYYTRQTELDREETSSMEVQVPDALNAEVAAMDLEWVEQANKIHALQSSIESEFDSQLAHRLHLYHTLHLPTLKSPCAYLPNRLLDLVFSPTATLAIDLGDPHFDPYRLVTCPHGNVDPREMHYVRRVTLVGARDLLAFVRQHAPDNPALARDPPTSAADGRGKCKACVMDVLTHHERVAFRKDGWDAWQHVAPPPPAADAARASSSTDPGPVYYWVPAEWINECLDLHELVAPRPEHLALLRCTHGKLTPDAAARVQVSDAHAQVLQSFCPEYVPSRTDSLVECDVCVQQRQREEREVQERMDAAFTEREQLSEVMPIDWTLQGVDEPIEFALFTAREYVRQCIDFYGGNPTPSDGTRDQAKEHDAVTMARNLEHGLWQRHHGWAPTAQLPETYVVLPASFIAAWWRFATDPAAAIRPKVVRFSALLCTEHGMLKFDPRETLDRSLLKFAVIPRQVWDERIGVFYPSDGGTGGNVVSQDTPVCKVCRERELLRTNSKGEPTYEVLVRIRKRGGAEAVQGRGGARKAATAGNALPNPAPLPPALPPGILPVDVAPPPRSTRSAANKKPTEECVYVHLGETVQDIKKEISGFAERLPMEQQLYLMPGGMNLADPDARVLESGVYHGCTIELQVDPVMVHDSDEEDAFATGGGGGRKAVRDSGGFGGLLSGSGGATTESQLPSSSANVNGSSEVVVLDDMDEDHERTPDPLPSSHPTKTYSSLKRHSASAESDGCQDDQGTTHKRRRRVLRFEESEPEDDLDAFVIDGEPDIMTSHHAQMQEDRELAMALSMSLEDQAAEQAWPQQRHPGGAMAAFMGRASAGHVGSSTHDVWALPDRIDQLPKLPKQVIHVPSATETQQGWPPQETVACSECTFINSSRNAVCEMCESLLPL